MANARKVALNALCDVRAGGAYSNITLNKYLNENGSEFFSGFMQRYANSKFVETIAEYEYSSTQEEDTSITTLAQQKQKKKRMYIYTLILPN